MIHTNPFRAPLPKNGVALTFLGRRKEEEKENSYTD